MAVFQLKDGRWIVQWRNPKPPPAYYRKYFGRGNDAEIEAGTFNAGLKLHPHQKRSTGPRQVWFDDITNLYLKNRHGIMADSTMDRLTYILRAHIMPAIGEENAYTINAARLNRYKSKRLKVGASRTTVHGEITYILAILNWAVKTGHLRFNPAANFEKPKRDDAVIAPATKGELELIMKHASDHLRRAILIAFATGIRPGPSELLKLRWDDVDWSLNVIRVESAKKGGPRKRVVPIHPGLRPHLIAWYEADKRSGPIIHWLGRPVRSIKKSWERTKLTAGITRRLRLYDLRHACATYALAGGGDLKAISEMLGHSRPDTTMRIYQHLDMDIMRRTIAVIPLPDTTHDVPDQ